MGKVQKFIRSLGDLHYFLGILITTISFVSAVVALLDVFGVDFVQFKDIKWLLIHLLILYCVAISILALYVRRLLESREVLSLQKETLEETGSILTSDLIASLKTALDAKDYLEVIRIGTALSKPFFVSGNYKARLSIGLLVEEAAASINDEQTQMIELIDSIGWMYVELGDFENGKKHIMHGLKYAEQIKNHFYISKANRHLGAICRRKEDFPNAEKFYKLSLETANNIEEDNLKSEAIAGTNYAQAMLYYYLKNFISALRFIDSSIVNFEKIKYVEKIIMAKTMKAQILLSVDKIPEAKDLLRISLNEAEKRTLRLEIARCLIGLTKIYIKEKDWNKAKEYLDKADKVEKYIQTASEVAEINILRTQIPTTNNK